MKRDNLRLKSISVLLTLILMLSLFAGCKKSDVPSVPDDTEPEKTDTAAPPVEVKEPEPIKEPEKESEKEPEVAEPEPEPVQEPEIIQPEEPKFYNPLTGVETEEDISANRPYAVMINNIKKATPTVGLRNADIIYECPVEGTTRLLAVFQDISKSETVGSVRSARPYYIDLALSYDAIYIHAGGSTVPGGAYEKMKSTGITRIDGVNGSGETFYRDNWRLNNMGYEHSLMLKTSTLPGYAEKNKFRTTHKDGYVCSLAFTDDELTEGESAEKITINYASYASNKKTGFTYDPESGFYEVSEYGSPMKDGDETISVKNVIILKTTIKSVDDYGRLSVSLTGSGEGYYVCSGKYVPITWSKSDTYAQFVYKNADGTPLEFARGKSWICVIPSKNGEALFE